MAGAFSAPDSPVVRLRLSHSRERPNYDREMARA